MIIEKKEQASPSFPFLPKMQLSLLIFSAIYFSPLCLREYKYSYSWEGSPTNKGASLPFVRTETCSTPLLKSVLAQIPKCV